LQQLFTKMVLRSRHSEDPTKLKCDYPAGQRTFLFPRTFYDNGSNLSLLRFIHIQTSATVQHPQPHFCQSHTVNQWVGKFARLLWQPLFSSDLAWFPE